MPFEIHETRRYAEAADTVYQAALGAVAGLEGKVVEQDKAAGKLEVKFDKKILGKVLGDRTHMTVGLKSEGEETAVAIEVYPLNAVGQKLLFGARKGVSQTVATWFFAHLEHRLPK